MNLTKIIKKLPNKLLPEGILLLNSIENDEGDIILNNIVIGNNLLILYPKKKLYLILDNLLNLYPYRNFIFQITGEAYDFNTQYSGILTNINNIIQFFNNKNLSDRLIFKSNNLSIKYSNINHVPVIFWLGKSICNIDVDFKKIQKHFLLQIRGRNDIREKLFYWIKDINLLDLFEYSFASSEPHHKDYKSLEGLPIKNNLDIHQMMIKEYHNTTFCNVVCESYFKDNSVFFTEKIDKPLTAKQPFIVLGSNNYLSKLKELGFKTFDKWWDESYDDELDDNVRYRKIQNVILEISSWSIDKCNDIYTEMIPNLNHNHKIIEYIKNNPQYSDGNYSNFDYIKNKIYTYILQRGISSAG